MEQVRIKVKDLIGEEALFTQQGQKVFNVIKQHMIDGKRVVVDFEGVTMLISFFLNIAVGQLYSSFSHQSVREQLSVEGMTPDDMKMLQTVVVNAKKFFEKKTTPPLV